MLVDFHIVELEKDKQGLNFTQTIAGGRVRDYHW